MAAHQGGWQVFLVKKKIEHVPSRQNHSFQEIRLNSNKYALKNGKPDRVVPQPVDQGFPSIFQFAHDPTGFPGSQTYVC